MTYVELTSTLKENHVLSTDDCEGGRYLAVTSGHSGVKVIRIELRSRKGNAHILYLSTYSECVIERTVCAYDQPSYI